MRTDLLDFALPPELIAGEPTAARDGARLLVVGADSPHRSMHDLPDLLDPATLLVVNDTRVINARLRGHRATGGRVEILLVRATDSTARRWTAMGRASKALREGTVVTVAEGFDILVEGRTSDGLLVVHLACDDPWRALEDHGETPLPPYLHRAPTAADRERYQTVYATEPGAVAAPTAGLHLTNALLDELTRNGVTRVAVTLHVGPGTFAPVTVDDLDQHAMHAEHYRVPPASAEAILTARASGRPVIAVGTTVVRTLESWAATGELEGDTRLLIQPGYAFKVVDGLLTNFHLPRSTLLALVMAFGGVNRLRAAYSDAIAERYRFFSYGDAMLIRRSFPAGEASIDTTASA